MPIAERIQGANVIDAGRRSPYWGEHVARYTFALPFVTGKSVLDIACGTGYGLAVLKEAASFVIGVDIAIDAAKEAKFECYDRAAVLLGDGRQLPFVDKSFDAVTSFETLEHLHQRSDFLAELRRVLRPGGKLVLSTPNANYTKPVNGKPSNPFHVFEYTPEELRPEIKNHFRLEEMLGQTLKEAVRIPPFYDAQMHLPKDIATQTRLFGWKLLNKLPLTLREGVSETIWKKPFYPTEEDYTFSTETIEVAPVLVAVCSRL